MPREPKIDPYSVAFKLWTLGYSIIPSGGGEKGKAPLVNWSDYQSAPPEEAQLEQWNTELKPPLWGIVTNNRIAVIDADTPETRTKLEAELGPPNVTTPRGGAHWYINTEGHPMKTAAGVLPGVDCRGVGGFVNIAGGEYDIKVLPIPESLLHWGNLPPYLMTALEGIKTPGPLKPGKPVPDGQRNATLTRIGGAMRRQGADQEAIEAALINIRCETPLPENEIKSIAASVCRYTPEPDGNGHHGHFNLTDYGNAERIVEQYGRFIRYSPERKMWLIWSGKRWEWDMGNVRIAKAAKKVARTIYKEASLETDAELRKELVKHAVSTERQVRIDAMIRSLESETGIAVYLDAIDSDLWLLNVANGTIDLRTGELHKHNADDLITEILEIPYDTNAASEEWASFLSLIFSGDNTLIAYIQRCLGYSITGDQSEQVFFFCYGKGFNGKSTLLNACRSVMGNYATQVPPTAFMVDKTKRGGPDETISSLKNKRLVCSTELEDGQRLSVSLVKRMTGGEPLWCEHKFEHGYTFQPTHKLWLSGNHEPVITDTTNSIWFRLKKIPFTIEIPEEERRKGYSEYLAKEHALAILAWLVAGCVAWYKAKNLGEPVMVKEAVAAYREQQDILHDFILEMCLFDKNVSIFTRELWEAYKKWCQESDFYQLGQRKFYERIREKDIHDARGTGNKPLFRGIRLLTVDEIVTKDTVVTENHINRLHEASTRETLVKTGNESNLGNYPASKCLQCGADEPIIDEVEGVYKCSICSRFYPKRKEQEDEGHTFEAPKLPSL